MMMMFDGACASFRSVCPPLHRNHELRQVLHGISNCDDGRARQIRSPDRTGAMIQIILFFVFIGILIGSYPFAAAARLP